MGRKRKYSSYQGEVGKKADNLIQRQFEASKLMEKCYTDVTEFAIPASSQKLYLSPVLDGFNSEMMESFSFLSLRCFMVTRRRFTHLNIETSYCRLY